MAREEDWRHSWNVFSGEKINPFTKMPVPCSVREEVIVTSATLAASGVAKLAGVPVTASGVGDDLAGVGDDLASQSGIPDHIRAGQVHEAERLSSLGTTKNTVVWRPSQADIDSAAFKVIVGDAKYTTSGLPKGTIIDATEGGLLEIKGGSSSLSSTYQLRLQT